LNVSVLASSSLLRFLERDIVYKLTRDTGKAFDVFGLDEIVKHVMQLLNVELSKLDLGFDFILIDCAPGISIVTEASIRLAELVIVPTIPDFLSTYGLNKFCANLWSGEFATHGINAPRRLPHVLITRHRSQVKEHKQTIEKIRNESSFDEPSFVPLKAAVPEAAAIAAALGKTGTGPTFKNKWGDMVPVFENLAGEVREIMKNGP
jgi:cellulose biosynthesis protein BcsQ